MASGRSHDRTTWALALPFGALWWPWHGLPGVAVAASAFVLGGLLLSPDLDTRSNPTRRWGPLRVLWWPYRRLLSHRSLVSHTPLLGTAGRLAYLGTAVALLCLALQPLGAPDPSQLVRGLETLWLQQRDLTITALVAVEASSWLHLIQDGDPVPRLPRLLRKRRRRGSQRRQRKR